MKREARAKAKTEGKGPSGPTIPQWAKDVSGIGLIGGLAIMPVLFLIWQAVLVGLWGEYPAIDNELGWTMTIAGIVMFAVVWWLLWVIASLPVIWIGVLIMKKVRHDRSEVANFGAGLPIAVVCIPAALVIMVMAAYQAAIAPS